MDGYIVYIRKKYGHTRPKKPHNSPHKHRTTNYGATKQFSQADDTSPALYERGIKQVQGIVRALLYVGRSVNNELIVALSAIWAQKSAAMEETSEAIDQLLDYVKTYPDDGILFWASDMILAGHADAGFLNESKDRIRAGAYIFLSEN